MRRWWLVWVLLIATQAVAEQDKYGALAYSTVTGMHGYATDHDSRAAAQGKAAELCASVAGDDSCHDILWFRNACGALAVGDRLGYGAAWDEDQASAENEALANCANFDTGCGVVRSICSSDMMVTALPEPQSPIPEVVERTVDAPPIPTMPQMADSMRILAMVESLTPWLDSDRSWMMLLAVVFFFALRGFLRAVKKAASDKKVTSRSYADLRHALVGRQGTPKVSSAGSGVKRAAVTASGPVQPVRASISAPPKSRVARKPFESRTKPSLVLSRQPVLMVVRDMNRERRRMREKRGQ